MDIQDMINAMSDVSMRTRADYHLTVGGAIRILEKARPGMLFRVDRDGCAVDMSLHSYRGYYTDLAFEYGDGDGGLAWIQETYETLSPEEKAAGDKAMTPESNYNLGDKNGFNN